MSTQGTHTLQFFVTLLADLQEFKLIATCLSPHIAELAYLNNATHFIQKVIFYFPLEVTLPFFATASKYFVDFALNKNSICVLKQMMKKIKVVEVEHSFDESVLKELKKNFMSPLMMNFDKIIQDSFGNYVVQFVYECLGEYYCVGITEMILKRFIRYSLHKFSGNVVYKCIS